MFTIHLIKKEIGIIILVFQMKNYLKKRQKRMLRKVEVKLSDFSRLLTLPSTTMFYLKKYLKRSDNGVYNFIFITWRWILTKLICEHHCEWRPIKLSSEYFCLIAIWYWWAALDFSEVDESLRFSVDIIQIFSSGPISD